MDTFSNFLVIYSRGQRWHTSRQRMRKEFFSLFSVRLGQNNVLSCSEIWTSFLFIIKVKLSSIKIWMMLATHLYFLCQVALFLKSLTTLIMFKNHQKWWTPSISISIYLPSILTRDMKPQGIRRFAARSNQ